MKQTIKANIAGFVFNIDEDAYYSLKRYLDNIHSRFADAQEGQEIINDVEARIAEHFTEATQKKQVITKEDVNHVIEIMGNPKDFTEEADDEQKEKRTKTSYKSLKRLYRDPDNAVLGGVCGGLGAYFNIDPIILRALFIVLLIISIGTAIIVYILLWLITPKAETTAQKLEMRGQKVTVSSIEDRIKEEFSEVQDNFSKWTSSQSYRNLVNFLNELGNRLWEILRIILIVLGYIFGIGIIIAAFFALAVLIISMFSAAGIYIPDFIEITFPEFIQISNFFSGLSGSTFLLAGISLTIGIPLILIIYTGIKLIFRIPGKEKAAGITALILWLIGVVMVIFSAFNLYALFSQEVEFSRKHTLEESQASAYYLRFNEKDNQSSSYTELEAFNGYYAKVKQQVSKVYSRPYINITKSKSNKPLLIITRKAPRGKNLSDSLRNAKKIQYNWQQKDSIVALDSYFSISSMGIWRGHRMLIEFKLPIGESVYLNENVKNHLRLVESAEKIRIQKMAGKKWIMTEDGLVKAKADVAKDKN